MNKNGDLPAMPVSCVDSDGYMTGTQSLISGMTKREQFAMAAMQGILSNPYWNQYGNFDSESVSKSSVEYADALLAELEKAR